MNSSIQENILYLKQTADKYPEILAIYLFGSQAEKKTGPLSDIDLGILLNYEITADKQFQLETEICGVLKTDKVDIVFLNDIPLEAAYSIIKDGVCLYNKNQTNLANVIFTMISRYLDMKYYSDIYYKYRFDKIGK